MFCAVTVNDVSVVNATSVPSVIVAFNGILNPELQFKDACYVLRSHSRSPQSLKPAPKGLKMLRFTLEIGLRSNLLPSLKPIPTPID